MKATLALAMANVMFAAATPLNPRAYVTQVDVKTVTAYVYPDGSPATHLGAQPTGDAVTYETVSAPSTSSSPAPSSSDDTAETEKPTKGSQEAVVPDLGSGVGVGSVKEASLNAHNAHRANHTCGQVEWDDNLAKWAQQLADSCSYRHDT